MMKHFQKHWVKYQHTNEHSNTVYTFVHVYMCAFMYKFSVEVEILVWGVSLCARAHIYLCVCVHLQQILSPLRASYFLNCPSCVCCVCVCINEPLEKHENCE